MPFVVVVVVVVVVVELFETNLPLFEHQQTNCSLADSFLDPMA